MKKLPQVPWYLLFDWVYHQKWDKAVVRPQRTEHSREKSAFLKLCRICGIPKPNQTKPIFLSLCSWISGSAPLPVPSRWMWGFLLSVCSQWKLSWNPRALNIPSWSKTCRWAVPLARIPDIFWEHSLTIGPLFHALFSLGSSQCFCRLWIISPG